MRTFKLIALMLATVFLLSGCFYSHVRTPLDTDLDKTNIGQKMGEAHMYSVLWLVAWGDASTAAAAKNAGITTMNHMDSELLQFFFGAFTRYTTVVYGD